MMKASRSRLFSLFSQGEFPVLLTCLLSVSQLPARAAQQQPGPMLAGIAHVAMRVSDLTRSRDFYGKLGFEEAFTLDQGGKPVEVFLKVNDRQFIELYPQGAASELVGFMHICFESEDIETLNHEYAARGLTLTPVKRAAAGNLLFNLQGPEQQNIEYTQYMPGSRHWNDRGKHLGANRISTAIAGLGIPMLNPRAGLSFYEEKLGFQPARLSLEQGLTALDIPGPSGEVIELVPSAPKPSFRLFFSVPDIGHAAARLKSPHLPFERRGHSLALHDPDGNSIVFLRAMTR